MKGLVQPGTMAHPAWWLASVLFIATAHVCCAADVPPAVHLTLNAVDVPGLARLKRHN